MKTELTSLVRANKELKQQIDGLKKQAQIHTPISFYLSDKAFKAAINAAARDAKQGEAVGLSFNGIPVKKYE